MANFVEIHLTVRLKDIRQTETLCIDNRVMYFRIYNNYITVNMSRWMQLEVQTYYTPGPAKAPHSGRSW